MQEVVPLRRWRADATPLRKVAAQELRWLLMADVERTVNGHRIHFGGLTFIAQSSTAWSVSGREFVDEVGDEVQGARLRRLAVVRRAGPVVAAVAAHAEPPLHRNGRGGRRGEARPDDAIRARGVMRPTALDASLVQPRWGTVAVSRAEDLQHPAQLERAQHRGQRLFVDDRRAGGLAPSRVRQRPSG